MCNGFLADSFTNLLLKVRSLSFLESQAQHRRALLSAMEAELALHSAFGGTQFVQVRFSVTMPLGCGGLIVAGQHRLNRGFVQRPSHAHAFTFTAPQ